jgi:hypothetical protein
MLIPSAMGVSSDILAAATTLAGLVLVFLAATIARYSAIPGFLQDTKTRARYRRKAWFNFVGFVLAVVAALLALFGKWFQCEGFVSAAAVAFVMSSLWVIATAVRMIRDIPK